MQSPTIPPDPTPEDGAPPAPAMARPWTSVACDADGLRYIPHMRDHLGELPARQRAALEAVGALRIAQHQLHVEMERWAERHDLTEGRLALIFRLAKQPRASLPMSVLAESMNTSPRNITGLVDALEKDGLVRRVPAPDDRRSIHAELTEAGRAKATRLWMESTQRPLPFTEGITDAELAQLRDLCLRILENVRSVRAGDPAQSPNPTNPTNPTAPTTPTPIANPE